MKNTWRFSGNELKYLQEVIDSGFGSGTSGSMNNRFEQAFAKKVALFQFVSDPSNFFIANFPELDKVLCTGGFQAKLA